MHLREAVGAAEQAGKQTAFSAASPRPRTYRTKLTLSPYAPLWLSDVAEGASLGTVKDLLSNL